MFKTALMMTAAAALLASAPLAAQKQKPKAQKPSEPCVCPEEAPAPPLREAAFPDCRDGADNDGDGYIDCADQDCSIYAICVAPPPAEPVPQVAVAAPYPAPPRDYNTMRELKRDLATGVITGPEFHRWWRILRLRREAEFERAQAEYRAGAITRYELKAKLVEIRAKYEG